MPFGKNTPAAKKIGGGEEMIVKLLNAPLSPRTRKLGTVSFYRRRTSASEKDTQVRTGNGVDGGADAPTHIRSAAYELRAPPAPWRSSSKGGGSTDQHIDCPRGLWVRLNDGSFIQQCEWATKMRHGQVPLGSAGGSAGTAPKSASGRALLAAWTYKN